MAQHFGSGGFPPPIAPDAPFAVFITLMGTMSMTAMADWLFSNTLYRHPKLKIITHHLGGMVPHFEGRVGGGLDQLGKRTDDPEDASVVERVVRDAALRELRILRPEPDAMAESPRILHRAQQDAGIGQWCFRLRESDASGFGELAHFSNLEALQADRQRSDRIDVRLVERTGTVLQHLDQTGLVERRIGVRRAGEARDASGHRGRHLGFKRRLVLESRLAQPGRKIDESGADDEARRIHAPLRAEAFWRVADRNHFAGVDVDRCDAVDIIAGVDQAPAADLDLHVACILESPSVQLPARMLITAMRTAMPNVTCGRITLRSPSATAESISTPRFIGPGCITIASGLASASLSNVNP